MQDDGMKFYCDAKNYQQKIFWNNYEAEHLDKKPGHRIERIEDKEEEVVVGGGIFKRYTWPILFVIIINNAIARSSSFNPL